MLLGLRSRSSSTPRRGYGGALAVWGALATFVGGCTEPFDAPSAYDSEVYLCDAAGESARNDAIASCQAEARAGGSCRGVMSFRGTLQGLPVTVESPVTGVIFAEARGTDGVLYFDAVTAIGASPYFGFRFVADSIGGRMDALPSEARTVALVPANPTTVDPLQDDTARSSLRLTVGGESRNFRAGSGALVVRFPSSDRIEGTFSGVYEDGDSLEGCFVLNQ